MTRAAVALLGLAACTNLDPDCPRAFVPPDRAPDVTVITLNIGNGFRDAPYALRIRDRAYEAHLGEQLRARGADVVFLQEVLPPTVCESFTEADPNRACYDADDHPAQAKRLLGDDYTVVCDERDHIECVGVRVDFGTIEGVAPGAFVVDGAETAPLPEPGCDFVGGECGGTDQNCDAESTISRLLVQTGDGPLRLVHGHPSAIGETCLQKQLVQTFDFADEHPTILAGDWNFDPTRASDIVPTAIWANEVGKGQRFTSHAARRSQCRFTRTSAGQDASLDRVLSDFSDGVCFTWQNPRIDDGFDFTSLDGGRADHFAVECSLYRRAP